jgi:hypothetical protein
MNELLDEIHPGEILLADSVGFHGLPDAGLLVRTLRTMVSASMATTTPKDMPTGIL